MYFDDPDELQAHWARLCQAVPELLDAEEEVRAYRSINQSQETHCRDLFCRRWVYKRIQGLVGSRREYDPSVPAWAASFEAFDTVRMWLVTLSGPCRGCAHARWQEQRE